jgi:hypothetical protein
VLQKKTIKKTERVCLFYYSFTTHSLLTNSLKNYLAEAEPDAIAAADASDFLVVLAFFFSVLADASAIASLLAPGALAWEAANAGVANMEVANKPVTIREISFILKLLVD